MTARSDVHVYYDQTSQDQTQYATELYERIRRECKYSMRWEKKRKRKVNGKKMLK